jgi:hypothetical protein
MIGAFVDVHAGWRETARMGLKFEGGLTGERERRDGIKMQKYARGGPSGIRHFGRNRD